jgi:hypothetical protein
MRASTAGLAMAFSALVIGLSGGDRSVAIGLTGVFASIIVLIHRFAGFGAMLVPLDVSLLHTVSGDASSIVYALVYSLFALMAYRVAQDHKACI